MLRKIRIALAALFFVGITLLFIGIGQEWWGWMAKLQFLPSCLALNFAVIGGVLLLTILFGRIYCSVICPMGVFQDVVMYIRRRGGLLLNKIQVNKLKKAKAKGEKPEGTLKPYVKHFGYVKEKWYVRYPVLILTIIAIIIGTQFFVALIAPYSAYGRIVRTIAGLAAGESILPSLLIVALVTFVVIAVCAWAWGRAWCNVICPVGTTLGLFSRFALFRPVIDKDKCNACGRCYRGCKSSCIDGEHHKIDYSRCVDCFDCIGRCKGGAIHYKLVGFGGPKTKSEAKAADGHDDGRRAFIATSIFAVAALASEAGSGKMMAAPAKAAAPQRGRIVPPGAVSEKSFYDHCTACQLCVSNCRGGVLRPSGDLEHFLQPQLDFSKGFCQPDCNNCSNLCPAGAILPLTLEEKRNTRIGVATVIADACRHCGKCEKRCPNEAIEMVDGLPVVDTAKCIGCGACEFACPAKPQKAIIINN